MAGLLLDTHALIWLVSGEPMTEGSLAAVLKAQAERALYVSSISACEAGLAVLKSNLNSRPNLLGLSTDIWFRRALRSIGARVVPITHRIAVETTTVPAIYGSGDPGDCFLIATARVRRLPLVTRDARIQSLVKRRPDYLALVIC